MSGSKKSFKDRLIAATLITIGLVIYQQIPSESPEELVPDSNNNFFTSNSLA